jgi:iron complex outermembrane receptor protein
VYAHEDANDYGQEFRLLSHKDSKWTWLVGAYAYHGKTAYDSPFQGPVTTISPGMQTVRVDTYAGFGELGYAFSDSWSLKVGTRYSSDKKDVTVSKSPAARITIAPVLVNPYKDSNTWGRLTSNVTLEHRADWGLTYARFAQGYKSGGYNYPAIFTGGSIRPVLSPEKLNSYELGYKVDMFQNRVRLDTSVFYYDFKDLQVNFAQTAAIVPSVFSENAGAAKVKGAELELTWLPIDLLNVRTGISYTDGKYTDYKNAATNFPNATNTGWVAGNFDATGKALVNTPKWTALLGLGYDVRIGQASLPVSVNYSWKSYYDEEFVIIPQQHNLRQGGYGLLGARIGLVPSANSRWEASVWGENLTNRIYNVVAIQNNVSFAPPRTFGADLKYSF